MATKLITLNGVETSLLIFGNPFQSEGKDVIVCVTGNPGIPDFYTEFAEELYKSTGFPICIVGHAGHVEVPDENSNQLQEQEHLFNLQGQITHKFELINNHIDTKSKLHLIGHSIGAWIILELLHSKQELINRVSSINLLFPTVQKMAETSNGKFINYVFRKLHSFLIFILYLLYLMPQKFQYILVELYLRFKSLPAHYNKRIIKLINYKVLEKVLFLAYDEMDTVTELNTLPINNVKHLCNVIYSDRDDWVPKEYMELLKDVCPDLPLKKVKLDHSFVLNSSEVVAEMVTDNIKRNCNNFFYVPK